jgi:hypothetical protein
VIRREARGKLHHNREKINLFDRTLRNLFFQTNQNTPPPPRGTSRGAKGKFGEPLGGKSFERMSSEVLHFISWMQKTEQQLSSIFVALHKLCLHHSNL